MKLKLALLLLALPIGVEAGQTCRDVYDPMNQKWVLVCTENDDDTNQPKPPNCHNVYDPMNQVWVLVCDK